MLIYPDDFTEPVHYPLACTDDTRRSHRDGLRWLSAIV